MNKNLGELHCAILWGNAREYENSFIDILTKYFRIIEIRYVNWKEEHFDKNLARLYGELDAEKYTGDALKKGRGEFILVFFLDMNPVYDMALSWDGHSYQNINVKRVKEEFRKQLGSPLMHATDSAQESNRQVFLFTGLSSKEYLKKYGNQKSLIKKSDDYFAGSSSWNSLSELFSAINNSECCYVVMRGFEKLPNALIGGDIDVLLRDKQEYVKLSLASNACNIRKKDISTSLLPTLQVRVGNKIIDIDCRTSDEGYYCNKWSNDMLNNRRLVNGVYMPTEKDAFYSLIYHSIFHKHKTKDYAIQRLESYACNIIGQRMGDNIDDYYPILCNHMHAKKYYVSRPHDKELIFNQHLVDIEGKMEELKHKLLLKKIRPIYLDLSNSINNSGCMNFFEATDSFSSKRLFIKYNKKDIPQRNLFMRIKKLHQYNCKNFPKPFYFYDSILCVEYIDGITLDKLLEKGSIKNNILEDIVQDLNDIAKTFIETRLIHRDLHLKNLLFCPKRGLVVVDFDHLVDETAINHLKSKFKVPNGGEDMAKPHPLCYDDLYSINHIIQTINSRYNKKFQFYYSNEIGNLQADFRLSYKILIRYYLQKIKHTAFTLKSLIHRIIRYISK